MKKKSKDVKKRLNKLAIKKKRQDMIDAGAYDGRFNTKVVESKKKYKRQISKKIDDDDNE